MVWWWWFSRQVMSDSCNPMDCSLPGSSVVLENTPESLLGSTEMQPVSPEYSLEELMLKLKLQYFGHLMQRADSLEKTWFSVRLKTGEGADRGWDGWMASPTHWTWVWANSGRWWRTGKPGVLQSMGSQTVRHDLVNWIPTSLCPWDSPG